MAGFNILRDSDPITALADTLDDLDRHINVVDAKARRSETNRLSMLHLHAVAALLIAPLFAAIGTDGMGGPTWAVTRQIPGAPYSLAALLFAGGVVLGASTFIQGLLGEVVGLWMIMIWYGALAVSFSGAVILWLTSGMPGGLAKPSLYAPVVYAHLTAIMAVHLHTLAKMHRARRRGTP